MIVKLLTEYHLEFLSLKGGCRGLSESTLVKMSKCWKYHATELINHSFMQYLMCWLRTSDTLIGYLPIFQMLPKFSLRIRYSWYSFK